MNTINCEHPLTIVHPSYQDFIERFTHITRLSGSRLIAYAISPTDRQQIYDGVSFFKVFHLPFPRYVKHPSSYQFFDCNTGEFQDVYIQVPCGKCSICEHKKVTSYLQRMQFALELDCNPPLFVTLTYNDTHLPSDGVSMKDIQNFKKRLNKLMSFVFPEVRLKYTFFSEYGKLGRPHYHGIIYGFPLFQLKADHGLNNFIEAVRMIQYCWRKTPKTAKKSQRLSYSAYRRKNYKVFSNDQSDPFSFGFVNVSVSSPKSFAYITKYIGKGTNVPEGKNKNFHSFSVNLGVSFVKSLKPYVFNNEHKLKYLSVQDGSVKKVSLCSYYIKKLFPSFNNLVSPEFRRTWRRFNRTADFFITNDSLPLWFRDGIRVLKDDIHNKFPFMSDLFRYNVIYNTPSYKKLQVKYAINFYNDFVEEIKREPCFVDGQIQYISLVHIYPDEKDEFLEMYHYFNDFYFSNPNYFIDVVKSLLERDTFFKDIEFNSDVSISSARCRRDKSIQIFKSKLF